MNLVQNAITYTSEGKIVITCNYNSSAEMVDILIEDSGIGIKDERKDEVFRIFKDKGSIGLGLSLCRDIARKYGGDITFESEHLVGSTFKLLFGIERMNDSNTN